MKTIQAALIFIFTTIVSACASDEPKDIRITVKNEWWITISPNGTFGISSLIDSNPMSMVGTDEGVIDYNVVKQKILGGEKFSIQETQNVAIASIDEEHKFLVKDELLHALLQAAGKANQWRGAGLNDRLIALLERRPLLKDKKKQNKALHPTDGAVEPEKPKE